MTASSAPSTNTDRPRIVLILRDQLAPDMHALKNADLRVPILPYPALGAFLSDIGRAIAASPKVTIFRTREIITLTPSRPSAEAVSVVRERILATAPLKEVEGIVGDRPPRYDDSLTAVDGGR